VHSHFADWHRLVEFEPRAEELESRWGVIDALSTRSSKGDVVSMVAVACGEAPASVEWTQTFAQGFKDADLTFPMVDNSALLSVLAAAAAIHVLDKSDNRSDLAAYAITASVAVGRTSPVSDLVVSANSYLATQSVARREPAAVANPAKLINQFSKPLKDALDATAHAGNAEMVDHAAFVTFAGQLVSAINAAANSAATNAAEWARIAMNPLREEINILWWILSGYSSSARRPWTDLTPPAAALVGGWELAGMVTTIPGPLIADEMLRQLLQVTFDTTPSVSVSEAVRELPEGLTGPHQLDVISELTPIAALVAGRQVLKGVGESQSLFDVAGRAYNEAMLVKAYESTP
jgi:GTPase-associated system-like protein